LFLACVVTVVFAGYQRIFSCFAVYDDEGYVMLSLRSFLEGHPLYEETYSQYGPGYYWVQTLIHRVTGWGVTHDVTRLKALALWVTVSVLAMLFVQRVTSCRAAALLGFLLSFFHLERLAMEPGHPTGLCTLATAGCLVLATYVPLTGAAWWRFGVLGGGTALVAMTKLNVGVFLLGSLSLAILVLMEDGRFRRALLPVGIAGVAILPIPLFMGCLLRLPVLALPTVVLASLLLTLWVACQTFPDRGLAPGALIVFWAASATTAALLASLTLADGTTPTGLLDGLVLQHRAFGSRFIGPYIQSPAVPPVTLPVTMWAIVAAVLALNGNAFLIRLVRWSLGAALVAICLRHTVESWIPLVHGGQERGCSRLLTSCVLPVAWVVLLPGRASAGSPESRPADRRWFARLTLCTVACLQPLAAFPVAGTQLATASLPALLVLLVAVAEEFQNGPCVTLREWLPRRASMVFAVAVGLATLGIRAYILWDARAGMTPLGLAGAERLRLPCSEVLEKRWLVRQLRAHADTFLHLGNGCNSFYFWTELPPPTAWNATLWPRMFTLARQERILEALLMHEHPCVVVNWALLPPPAVDPRMPRTPLPNPTHSPLVDYVNENFVAIFVRGDLEIWMLKPGTSRRWSDVAR